MKTRKLISATLVAAMTLSSCKEDSNYVYVVNPIELDTYSIDVPCEGGTYEIHALVTEEVVLCNKYIFYASKYVESYSPSDIDARWFKVHLDGKNALIEVSANMTEQEREGGFTICSAKTHDSSQITIKQAGK